MLDRIPTQYDIHLARQAWDQGRASCEDIAILNWANPQGMRYASPCDDPFGSIADGIRWPF